MRLSQRAVGGTTTSVTSFERSTIVLVAGNESVTLMLILKFGHVLRPTV